MWGHYGDGCRGTVLEFSGQFFSTLQEVRYSSYENDMLPSVLKAKRLIELFKDNSDEMRKFEEALLLTKHDDWQYEKEHRFLCDPNIDIYPKVNEVSVLLFPKAELVGIYFGLNCCPKIQKDIMDMLTSRNLTHVKKYKMRRQAGYVKMYPEEIAC